MPDSKKQYRFFKWLESNPEEAKKRKISSKVIKDYTKGMTKTRFKKLKEMVKKK